MFKNLTPDQQELFERVYAMHMSMMGTEKRKQYTLEQLKNVVWDDKENCLKVYFKNGDWWHYTPSGEWY